MDPQVPQPPIVVDRPSVGRIVHVHMPTPGKTDEEGSEPLAAIVTKVWHNADPAAPRMINAHVFYPGGHGSPVTSIQHRSATGPANTYWTWPPRV